MEPTATSILLAALGILLLFAGVASPLSQRLGVPGLLLFLLLGMAAGSEGFGGIPFEDYGLAFRLGTIALALILFDGGLNTAPAVFRRAALRAALLATVGVFLTAFLVAGCALLLGAPLAVALLIGAVVSSTDAAAVFPVLRGSRVRLRESTGATLEVESGLNDPAAVLLTLVATSVVLGEHEPGLETVGFFALQLGIGVLGGAFFGFFGRALLRRLTLPAAGLYPVLTTAIAFTAFGMTGLLGGSGFLAVYLAALMLASGALPYRTGIRRVHDSLAWLSQILMFLLLGLLVFPSRLLELAANGLALAGFLAFVARPVAVLITLWPFRAEWAERVFIAWVGLRGAVPIILASYPVLRGVPDGEEVFHLVFFVVLVNSLVPGATVSWLARRLRLAERAPPPPPAAIELVSLREFPGDFVWYTVSRVAAVCGVAVRDLPLPQGSVVVLLLRGDEVVVPRGDTILHENDHACLFRRAEDRALLDLLFGREESETP